MIDIPCVLLGIYSDGWLIGFDDKTRGLDLSLPCYVPEYCIYAFTPYHLETGELRFGTNEYGPGFVRLAEPVWSNMHHWIAKELKERRRIEAAEAAAARKKAEKNPRVARRTEDRMLRARNEKAAKAAATNQTQLALKWD